MSALFTLPKQIPLNSSGSMMPGAKLTFSLTNTSTPQSTYQDADLTTAHSNPVEADINGVFPPIYIDGSLDDYRVSLSTAADVLVYTIDDYPAGPESVTSFTINAKNNPYIHLKQRNAASNNRDWRIQVENTQFKLTLLNTALSVEQDALVIERFANDATEVAWTAFSHTINGDESLRGDMAIKELHSTRNNTTTLSADSELVLDLQEGRYVVEGELSFYATTTAGMGMKFDLNYSGTTSASKNGLISYFVNAAAGAAGLATPHSFATLSTNSAAPDICRFAMTLTVTTAGNLSLRFAQASATANNLNLLALSWMRATAVPTLA